VEHRVLHAGLQSQSASALPGQDPFQWMTTFGNEVSVAGLLATAAAPPVETLSRFGVGPRESSSFTPPEAELPLVASPPFPSLSELTSSESDIPSSDEIDSLFGFSSNDVPLKLAKPDVFALSRARTTLN